LNFSFPNQQSKISNRQSEIISFSNHIFFMKTNLASYSTNNYAPGSNPITRICWYFTNIVFFMNPLNPFSSIKVLLLRLFGAKIGKGVNMKPSVNIKYPWRLTIGDYAWIGEKVWIDNLANVSVGEHCCISQGVILLCGNHNYKLETFNLIVGDIILEEGVWIGANAIVCPGVTCQSHAMLTAGSVATKTLEAYTIYQGNPAVKIRDRS